MRGRGRRPARDPCRPGGGPCARPGRVVPVDGVWPWRTSRTVVGGGGFGLVARGIVARPRGRERGRGSPGTERPVQPTRNLRRWIPWPRSTARSWRAAPAPGWWRGARRWRSPSGPPTRRGVLGTTGARLRRSGRRAGRRRVWHRRRTAPTAPVACSPATGRVSGSTGRCGGPATPTRPEQPAATTGWRSPAPTSPLRCGARRRPTSRPRASAIAAGRSSSASWPCSPAARVYLALGQFGYQAVAGVLGVRPRPGVRPRARGGAGPAPDGTHGRCSARTT